jgi:hypothetical protein
MFTAFGTPNVTYLNGRPILDGTATVIGKYSLHEESSQNKLSLINYAKSLNKTIGSTPFPYKGMHKITWRPPDGSGINQIDHVLIDTWHRSNLLDVQSYRGMNVDSDHFLIIAKLRPRINMANNNRRQQGHNKI